MRNEHFRAFGKEWFAKHQRRLLALANSRWTAWAFRRILRIHGDRSHSTGHRLSGIGPNFVSWHLDDGRVSSEFRTHDKFSKRIYFAFRPVWWAMHAWDALFADRLVPRLGFGFSVLTAYPDPDPETTTVDGEVGRDVSGFEETWSTLVAGAGNFHNDTSSERNIPYAVSLTGLSVYSFIIRGIFLFDTSSIGASNTIDATVLSFYVTAKEENFGNAQSVGIVLSTPASNTALADSDYGQLGTTRQASDVAISAITTSAYNDWTFNSTGRGNVSKTGVTKLGTRLSGDIDNTAPTTSGAGTFQARIRIYMAYQTGTSNDPRLVVTYTVISPSASASPSLSPSASLSPSSSVSSSPSASVSPSGSSSPSLSPSASLSPSSSRSPSASVSPSPSISPSSSPSPSLPQGYIVGGNNNTGIMMGVRKVRQ